MDNHMYVNQNQHESKQEKHGQQLSHKQASEQNCSAPGYTTIQPEVVSTNQVPPPTIMSSNTTQAPKIGARTSQNGPSFAVSLAETNSNLTDPLTQLKFINREVILATMNHDNFTELYNVSVEKIREKKIDLVAFNEIICTVEEHIKLNHTLEQECLPHEKSAIANNIDRLQTKLNIFKADRSKVEKELKEAKSFFRKSERELNTLRPKLTELHKKRDEMKLAFLQNGISREELNEYLRCDAETELGRSAAGRGMSNLDPVSHETVEKLKRISINTAAINHKNHSEHLIKENWFLEGAPRELAVKLLKDKPSGTFLIRTSTKCAFALSIVVDGIVQHCAILQDKVTGNLGFTEGLLIFPDIESLVLHFRDESLKSYNPLLTTCLMYPFRIA